MNRTEEKMRFIVKERKKIRWKKQNGKGKLINAQETKDIFKSLHS